LDKMKDLRDVARRSRGPESVTRWFEVGRYCVERSRWDGDPRDSGQLTLHETLREASTHLGAQDLAALAGICPDPVLSEAMIRALEREKSPSSRAEAAAEARDALARFGYSRARFAVDAMAKDGEPALGAGPACRSVFHIAVIAPFDPDSSGREAAIRNGLLAGLRAGAGDLANRFVLWPAGAFEDAEMATDIRLRETSEPAGVLIVAGGRFAWSMTTALARERGVLAVDARPRSSLDGPSANDGPIYQFGSRWSRVPRFQDVGWMGRYSNTLAIEVRPSGEGRQRPAQTRPLTLRPPDFERARRLALALRGRPEIRRVAVAVSESGDGFGFASCIEQACRALDLPVDQLDYTSGIRNYAAEADRFAATQAGALVLTGSDPESAEWLRAIAKRKLKPLVLGTLGIDPAGFHEHERAMVEGAILVGDEWSDWSGIPGSVGAAADSAGLAGSADFGRAFAFGQWLGLAVHGGNWTPTRLARAAESASLPHIYGASDWNWLGSSFAGAGSTPARREVPLWVVRGGRLEPYRP
jgi:hypothetical protein